MTIREAICKYCFQYFDYPNNGSRYSDNTQGTCFICDGCKLKFNLIGEEI